MANLDIAERRLPQDGRIRLRVQGKEIDLRVSTVTRMLGVSVEVGILETAQIAVQSALTGHLVLSTVHTNDAPSTVNRLLDMGVEDYLLTSTVIGILAQRLVRKLCEHCKEPNGALPELVEQMRLRKFSSAADITLWHARGCSHCSNTGYTGRICITEIMPMTDAIRSLVMKHANAAELRAEAIRVGMVPMYEDGMRKAVKGVTTFEEVLRATRED
jgi:general secretion pathway protein E